MCRHEILGTADDEIRQRVQDVVPLRHVPGGYECRTSISDPSGALPGLPGGVGGEVDDRLAR